MNYVDFNNKPLNVGDRVAYPTLSDRSCQLEEGTVLEIFPHTPEELATERAKVDWKYERAHQGALIDVQQAEEDFQRWLMSPSRVRIRPTCRGSRWRVSHTTTFENGLEVIKPINVTANASSLVVLS